MSQIVVELGDIGPSHFHHLEAANRRQDEAPQVAPVFPCGAGLQSCADMFTVKPLGQGGNIDGFPTGSAVRRGILPIANSC